MFYISEVISSTLNLVAQLHEKMSVSQSRISYTLIFQYSACWRRFTAWSSTTPLNFKKNSRHWLSALTPPPAFPIPCKHPRCWNLLTSTSSLKKSEKRLLDSPKNLCKPLQLAFFQNVDPLYSVSTLMWRCPWNLRFEGKAIDGRKLENSD